MACNTCFKAFSMFRPEKGCPNCGFSYCSKCLNNRIFVKKLNKEKLVCVKCSQLNKCGENHPIPPPDSFLRRNAQTNHNSSTSKCINYIGNNNTDLEIEERLKKLKQSAATNIEISDKKLTEQLKRLKEDTAGTSDTQLAPRMPETDAIPASVSGVKPKRTEHAEVEDLLKQLNEVSQIESNYNSSFANELADIEMRLQKLKGSCSNTNPIVTNIQNENPEHKQTEITQLIEKPKRTEHEEVEDLLEELKQVSKIESNYNSNFANEVAYIELRLLKLKNSHLNTNSNVGDLNSDTEDEQTELKQIIEKLVADMRTDDEEKSAGLSDELPFCEICNDDAKVRCKGCKYLFCLRCFNEHKDDDCAEYEIFDPPK